MFCSECGAQMREGAAFCDQCGARLGAPEETAAEPVQATVVPEGADPPDKTAMILGIVGLALCELGIPGIILGNSARKRAAGVSPVTVKSRLGRIFGNVSLGVGIGFTVFWTLYIALIVLAVVFAVAAGA